MLSYCMIRYQAGVRDVIKHLMESEMDNPDFYKAFGLAELLKGFTKLLRHWRPPEAKRSFVELCTIEMLIS